MKAGGTHKARLGGRIVSVAIIAIAVVLAGVALVFWSHHPSTNDASIDADVVHVAAIVGGRIVNIAVNDNQRVHKGQLLFTIDPQPYELAVAQTKADLGVAQASLATKKRSVATQRATATLAAGQVKSAKANYQLAQRTATRLRPLAAKGYVPKQRLDRAEVAEHDAAVKLDQARVQHAAAVEAVDSVAAAQAAVQARRAALALAQYHLDSTTVRAEHNGLVVGLSVSAGEFVAPGQALFTLIDSSSWFALANFRESDLNTVRVGDCATVYTLMDQRLPIAGTVESIGWGVLDDSHIKLPRAMPLVARSLNWVRVEQRFPVRIRLQDPPARVMRVGASASVEIRHGRECR